MQRKAALDLFSSCWNPAVESLPKGAISQQNIQVLVLVGLNSLNRDNIVTIRVKMQMTRYQSFPGLFQKP